MPQSPEKIVHGKLGHYLTVDFSPDGAVLVTVKLFPQKIEIEEVF